MLYDQADQRAASPRSEILQLLGRWKSESSIVEHRLDFNCSLRLVLANRVSVYLEVTKDIFWRRRLPFIVYSNVGVLVALVGALAPPALLN